MIQNIISDELIEKEKARIELSLEKINFSKSKMAQEIHGFVKNYFADSTYFFEKGDYISAFEALLICWAYLDVSAKLGIILIPDEIKESFTV